MTIGGVSLADARRAARNALNDILDGVDPATRAQAEKAEKIAAAREERAEVEIAKGKAPDNVETLLEDFIARHCARLRSGVAVARVLRKELAPWTGRRIGEITRRNVADLLDGMVDRGVSTQANRTLAYVSKFFSWALARDLVDRNPCDGVEKPADEQSRDRALDDREIALVWRAVGKLDRNFEAIVKLLILTGARKAEIADAVWPEVDLDAALLRLPAPRTKNKRPHDLPLSAPALAILGAVPRTKGDPKVDGAPQYVFTTTGKTPVSGFSKWKAEVDAEIKRINGAPINPWTIHDLRRSAATGLARLGVGVTVIEKILNHVSGSLAGVAGVYNRHSFQAEMRDALELWGRHVEQLVADTEEPR